MSFLIKNKKSDIEIISSFSPNHRLSGHHLSSSPLFIMADVNVTLCCISGRVWARVGEIITAALQDENFEVDARRCRERTMLLLDYYKKQDFSSLRRSVRTRLGLGDAEVNMLGCWSSTCSCFRMFPGLEQRGCMPRRRICSTRF